MSGTRQLIESRVVDAFMALGIIKNKRHGSKYENHFEAIANFLLSIPGTDEYVFVRELVDVMKLRGCVFVTPAICSNRARMEEAAERLAKGSPMDPERIWGECEKLVDRYISGGMFKTRKSVLFSPSSGLPAWYRIVASKGDEDVFDLYMDAAREEMASDRKLSEYICARHKTLYGRILK